MTKRKSRCSPSLGRASNAGLSLIEVLVALVVGLLVVAGASVMLLNQLKGHRRLLLESRLQQDLQVVVDLMSRSLRRQGYSDPDNANITDWRLSQGVIQMKWDHGTWQSLTDIDNMMVTGLDMPATERQVELGSLCTPACTLTDGSCPRVATRSIELTVTARAASDSTLQREIRDTIVVRNPQVTGACP